jgi:rod shape-determining protein MreC
VLNLNKRNLIVVLATVLFVFFLSGLIPSLRPTVINTLKFPLTFLSLIGREVRAIVFYHRNFIQYDRLKNDLGILQQRLNTFEEAKLENARLKELLALKKESPHKVIAAKVIARDPDNWSSIIIISKGSYHGIRAGCVVIGYEGLLGRVIESGSTTSKIMLLNDPNLSVSGLSQRSRQEGLICGTLGNSLIMKYLPKDADINTGDKIITSGLTLAYPKGLVIGTVVGIEEEFSGLSKYAVIKPAVNLSNTEEVLIIVQ